MMLSAGTVLFSGWHPEHLEAAKQYIADKNFTAEDVKLVRRESGMIFIETKRTVEI